MDGAVADISGGHMPPDDFVEAAKEALVDINLTDSSELWLMQWPSNLEREVMSCHCLTMLAPDFDGSEVTLKLHDDGASGSFEGSSGKDYNVVSSAALHPNAQPFSCQLLQGQRSLGRFHEEFQLLDSETPRKMINRTTLT